LSGLEALMNRMTATLRSEKAVEMLGA
jgi:hypothetical protein